jgi:hypothetical protein
MTRVSAFLFTMLVSSTAIAGEMADFRAASADAARKFHPGYQWLIKFEDWISNPAVDVLNACGSYPNTNLTCDIVFVVGADGQIKRTLFGPHNKFRGCVARHFRTVGLAPKPPADSWTIQIRIIDGKRFIRPQDPQFLIFNSYKP